MATVIRRPVSALGSIPPSPGAARAARCNRSSNRLLRRQIRWLRRRSIAPKTWASWAGVARWAAVDPAEAWWLAHLQRLQQQPASVRTWAAPPADLWEPQAA